MLVVQLSANPESGVTPFNTTFSVNVYDDDQVNPQTPNITNCAFSSNSSELHSQSGPETEATFTFNTTGLFTVSCTVTTNMGTATGTMEINVYEPMPSLSVLRTPYLLNMKTLAQKVVKHAEVVTNNLGSFDLERFSFTIGETTTIYKEYVQLAFKPNTGERIFLIGCMIGDNNTLNPDAMWALNSSLSAYYNQPNAQYNSDKPFIGSVGNYVVNIVPDDSVTAWRPTELVGASIPGRTLASTDTYGFSYAGNNLTPILLKRRTYSGENAPYIEEVVDCVYTSVVNGVGYYAVALKALVKYPSGTIRECFNWHFGLGDGQFGTPFNSNYGSINPEVPGWSEYFGA